MPISHIPAGYSSVTPYLVIDGAAKAIDFYKEHFGAKEDLRLTTPEGRVGHAELIIGTSKIMLADECSEMGFRSPKTLGGAGVSLLVYVENCDAVFEKVVAAGAKVVQPLRDQFYGDRSGTIEDPFGHVWSIATHTEDVPPEEMAKRAAAAMGGKG